MNSLGLTLFHRLCELGNALEAIRDLYRPDSDDWLWHTEVLALLDTAVDMLVHSHGLGGADDGLTPDHPCDLR